MKHKLIIFLSIFFISINSVYAKETVKLSDCVDGDTIKVILNDNKEYTIRMLAIDTPESVHPTKKVEYYGKEASEYTCNLVTNAKKIEIEYDEDSDKSDKYNRLLVWVFVDENLLQKDLIENGYAKVAYLYGDYKYTNELEKTQEKASAKEIGIWNTIAKNEYNNKFGIDSDIEEVSSPPTEEITSELDRLINKFKSFKITDYIILIILILIVIFCGNKKITNKAKKTLKKYFK